MTSVTPAPSPILTWPADRFYWATLPPGIIHRDGVLSPGATELVRDQVPVPMEQLHAVVILAPHTSVSGGNDRDSRSIVCMIEREELRTLDSGVLMLTPEAIPACVSPQGMDAPDPSRLNLLTGEFEPRAIRSHHHRRAAIVLGAIAISCAAVAMDLSRRTESLRAAARDDDAAAHAVLARVSGSDAPDAIALERELEQLRAIASPSGHAISFDAPRALAEIVGAWPSDTGPSHSGPSNAGASNAGPSAACALPQSLSVRPDMSTITVRTPGAPAAFLAAWKTPAGWSSAEPRVQPGVQSNAQGGNEGGLVTLELKQLAPPRPENGGAP